MSGARMQPSSHFMHRKAKRRETVSSMIFRVHNEGFLSSREVEIVVLAINLQETLGKRKHFLVLVLVPFYYSSTTR
jgi:hypothetical protein